jgi:hypothetical protein
VPSTIVKLAATLRHLPKARPAQDIKVFALDQVHGQVSVVRPLESVGDVDMKPGLYANILKKRERIREGSGERMRKPGSKGAPTAKAFKAAAKTAKKNK